MSFFAYTIFYVLAIIFAYSYSGLSIVPKYVRKSNYSKEHLHLVWIILLPLFFVLILQFLLFDYNFVEGLLQTAKYENRHFTYNNLLLHSPLTYFITRIECISEIVLFFGPILSYFSYNYLRASDDDFALWTKYTILFFLLLILTGAFRTGETARPFLGIFPLLLISSAYYIEKHLDFTLELKKKILSLLFIQVIIFQSLFWFYW